MNHTSPDKTADPHGRKPRVAVVFGGRSSEHGISCVTAGSVLAAIDREAYANDLGDYRTLVGVTDNVNQSKSDKSPDAWKPPLTGYHCTYARMWVKVKYVWSLTVTSAEKSAVTTMLNGC